MFTMIVTRINLFLMLEVETIRTSDRKNKRIKEACYHAVSGEITVNN